MSSRLTWASNSAVLSLVVSEHDVMSGEKIAQIVKVIENCSVDP